MWEEAIAKPCPTCGAEAGKKCVTISGNKTAQPHLARWAEPGTYRERHVYTPYRRQKSWPACGHDASWHGHCMTPQCPYYLGRCDRHDRNQPALCTLKEL